MWWSGRRMSRVDVGELTGFKLEIEQGLVFRMENEQGLELRSENELG